MQLNKFKGLWIKIKIVQFVIAIYQKFLNKVCESKRTKQDYLQRMSLYGMIIKQDLESIRLLAYEINKIGTNINQVAKKANETNVVMANDIKDLRKDLNLIYEKLSFILEKC